MTPRTPLSTVMLVSAQRVDSVLAGRSLESMFSTDDDDVTRTWDAQTQAAHRDLTYGALRHWRALRWLARQASGRDGFEPPQLATLICVALYALRHTKVASHVVVGQAVEAAREAGFGRASGLMNALLRQYQRRHTALENELLSQPAAIRESYPDWWIARLQRDWPEQWEAIACAGNARAPMTLRVNRRRLDAATWLEKSNLDGHAFSSAGIVLEHSIPVRQVPGFAEGEVSVQDAGAQLCVAQLDVRDGMRVLDACSAPGGKTAAIAEAADVDLIALDIAVERQRATKEALARLDLRADVRVGDAAVPQSWFEGRQFDRILLDAPCTASGVIRRHVDGKWLKRFDDLPKLVRQQRDLLTALWSLLKPGGLLLYVTCSVFRDENERQVAWFCTENHDARAESVVWPNGIDTGHGGQLLPGGASSTHNHDGFFCARIWKHAT